MVTDPCQEPWPDRGEGRQWTELAEIWHLSAPRGHTADRPVPGPA
ncbi:hypothetical protein [Kitasatospora sp. NPDC050463]